MKKFDYIFDAFQDFFVGLAVTSTVTILLESYVDVQHFIIDVLIAFAINYITGLLINTRKLTSYIAKVIKIKKDKKSFALLQVLVNTLIYVTVISVCMFIIKAGFTPIVLMLLKQTYIALIIVAYIVGFLMAPISAKMALKISGGRKDD